ncbi:MAG: hypothetical protein QOI70_1874, partial [Microbacteriaceae bacterium]|nr:hypothetical protein [Microbacteriaceae bacterium]
RVSESLGDVDRAVVDVIQSHRVPLSECRGTDPNVDDEVEYRPVRARHVLRLTKRNLGVVDAADNALLGHGSVRLAKCQRVPDRLLESVEPIALKEDAAVIRP